MNSLLKHLASRSSRAFVSSSVGPLPRVCAARAFFRFFGLSLIALIWSGPVSVAQELIRHAPAPVQQGTAFTPSTGQAIGHLITNPLSPDSVGVIVGELLAQAGAEQSAEVPTTERLGTWVSIGGERALVLSASATRVEFLVPRETAYGPTDVVFHSGVTGLEASVEAEVRHIAPRLLTFDSQSKWGLMIDGAGVAHMAFSSMDPQDISQAQILAIRGTGIRFAGNPERSPSDLSSLNDQVEAYVQDSAGTRWNLPVVSAGPVVDSPGIDEVRVRLIVGMKPASVLTLVVVAESIASNPVLLTVKRELTHTVSAVEPRIAAPGMVVDLQGANFLPVLPDASRERQRVYLRLSGGVIATVVPISASETRATFVVPWVQTVSGVYAGAAKVCLEIDEEEHCAENAFTIMPPLQSSGRLGDELLKIASRRLESSLAGTELDGTAGAALSELRSLIDAARDGTPKRIQVVSPVDGSSIESFFDAAAVQRLEAAFLALETSSSKSGLTPANSLQRKYSATAASSANSAVSEQDLLNAAIDNDQTDYEIDQAENAVAAGTAAVVITPCLAGLISAGTSCAAGLAAGGYLANVGTGVNLVLYAKKVLGLMKPRIVYGIRTDPSAIDFVDGGGERPFEVFALVGTANVLTGSGLGTSQVTSIALKEIVHKLAEKAATSIVTKGVNYCCLNMFSQLPASAKKKAEEMIGNFVSTVAGGIEDKLIDYLNSYAQSGLSAWAASGATPLEVPLTGQGANVAVTDPIVASAGFVKGSWRVTANPDISGGTKATARPKSGLVITPGLLTGNPTDLPSSIMQINVKHVDPLQFTSDKSTYAPNEKVILEGKGFIPQTKYSISLRGDYIIYFNIDDVEASALGQFKTSILIPLGAADGGYVILVTRSSTNATVTSKTIEIKANRKPASPVARLKLSSGTKAAGNGETIRLEVSPTRIAFDASQSDPGDGSVLVYDWRSNGSPLGSQKTFSAELNAKTTVTLKVTNGGGQVDTALAVVEFVPPTGPAAHFKMSAQGKTANDGGTLSLSVPANGNTDVTFGSTSTQGGAAISTYAWKSNGSPICGNSSTCTFNFGAASNTISLTVADSNGQISTATGTVALAFQAAPRAHFSMSAQNKTASDGGTLSLSVPVNGNVDVTFGSTSTQGDAAISTYAWKSNGTTICTNSSTCTFPFSTPSNTITLTVTDSNNLSSTATGQVNVATQSGPTAHFNMSGGGRSGTDGQTLSYTVALNSSVSMTFSSTSTQGSAAISSYVWKSNGTTICNNSSTCTFPFSTPSNTITLTVTDSNNLSSTATGQVNVTH
ncbi:MAG: hypothetical protein NTZ56_16585 [Acidobacteria bacterium]|nr:hypothetical protein [Acidobacteriota bacterium]